MTDKTFRIIARISIIAFSVFIWLRPLFYAYHHALLFDFVQFALLAINVVLIIISSVHFNPLRMKWFVLFAFVMMSYPLFHEKLVSKSEKIFFERRQDKMEEIIAVLNEGSLLPESEEINALLDRIEVHSIEKGVGYVAFGVHSFLDNTDGFIFVEGGELPSAFFDGNLRFTDSIDVNWYSFSTR